MKSNARNRCFGWLVGALALVLILPAISAAAESGGDRVALTLNAGESYVIDGVASDATPGVKVVDNARALYVYNNEPGKVTLLGAEKGKWAVSLKMKDGKQVTYDVAVNSRVDIANPLKPHDAPPAISGTTPEWNPAAPPKVGALDSGAGPVDSPKESPGAAVTPPTESVKVAANGGGAPSAGGTGREWGGRPESAGAPQPSQTASEAMQGGVEKWKTNPAVAATGGDYWSPGVSGGKNYLPEDSLALMTGTSRVIDFPARVKRVSIADTDIADIQVINPFQVNLIAHKPGFTTLAVWNTQGSYDERQVRVQTSGPQQVLLNVIVAELNRQTIENQGINFSAALTSTGISFVSLPGLVASPYSQQTNLKTFGGGGTSSGAVFPPGGNPVPLLLSQGLTYGVSTTQGQGVTESFFQFLESHNMAKILAQPRLLANSGEQAKFLSGGEIPIVIAQALNTSIVFKQFGTSVEFVPTVVGKNDVELLVKPEVSQPDFTLGVDLFGFRVPAFITRRAETAVKLRDNQTLILAGLILGTRREVVQKVPYLGDIPYVAGLFRNTSYEDVKTELVMSVTPQIVRPLPTGGQVYLPPDGQNITPEDIRTKDTHDVSRPRF
ncbi:MAG: pilus assembly protein N-terminal domain-containing protein [Candidatus Binataceae bacterium]